MGVERAQLAEILDLLAEDSRLNVYAGELEVRPPAAPTTRGAREEIAIGEIRFQAPEGVESQLFVLQGVILTVAERAPVPIMCWRYGLPWYFVP